MPQRVFDGDGWYVAMEVLRKGLFIRSGIKSLPGHSLRPSSPAHLAERVDTIFRITANSRWRYSGSQSTVPIPDLSRYENYGLNSIC